MVRTREGSEGAMKLTEQSVTKLKPPAKGYVIDYDNGHNKAVPGFGVRVTANGAKSFVFSYRFQGRTPRITIGKFGPWTALAARQRAIALRRLVDLGRDPMGERSAERNAPLMSELFNRYLEEWAAKEKKPRSVAEDWSLIHGGRCLFDAKKRTFEQPKKPFNGTVGRFFSKMQVAAVTREDVLRFHGDLRQTPFRANRGQALLSKAMNLAEVWKLRPDNSNPCRHVKRYEEPGRDRYLDEAELTALGKALTRSKERPEVVAAIRLLLFTGTRVSELLSLRRKRVDMRTGTVRLEDAKAGARDVHLSTPALAVLSELPVDNEFVFGGLTYPVLDKAWRRIRNAAGLDGVRIHDLRHTTGTYAGAAGFNAFVVRDLLGHKTMSMTAKYVQRHTDPVKEANEQVSGRIAAAMRGEEAELFYHPKTVRR
jgi:integrase